jgi:hypothetical protein
MLLVGRSLTLVALLVEPIFFGSVHRPERFISAVL